MKIPVTPDHTLYDQLGGREAIERVHHVFYDKMFDHPWLGQFFRTKDKNHQISQQTEFMMRTMGGPQIYGGRMPGAAHEHLFITEEMFDLRHKILCATMDECGIPEELAKRWAYIDYCFKAAIVKDDISQCRKRFNTDEILTAEKPPE